MVFEIPDLEYEFNALEPEIDAKTMEIHHDKHHGTYVAKLNTALEKYPELFERTAEELLTHLHEIPEDIRTVVRNNGGGHVNHTLFWQIMTPEEEKRTFEGDVADKIEETFGSFDEFKKKFADAAAGRFGSGWAWLVVNPDGDLEIISTANQDSPLTEGLIPILGLDVWEHAYYLKYQNKRPDYIAAWWKVVNWQRVDELYSEALA